MIQLSLMFPKLPRRVDAAQDRLCSGSSAAGGAVTQIHSDCWAATIVPVQSAPVPNAGTQPEPRCAAIGCCALFGAAFIPLLSDSASTTAKTMRTSVSPAAHSAPSDQGPNHRSTCGTGLSPAHRCLARWAAAKHAPKSKPNAPPHDFERSENIMQAVVRLSDPVASSVSATT